MDQEASETQKVPRRKTALTYQVILDPGTILHLATGERFRDLDGHLRVEPNDSASPIDSLSTTLNHIGLLQYMEAYPGEPNIRPSVPAGYHIQAGIPKAQFDQLVAVARMGRIPPAIRIDVDGMKFPDEFSLEWDNKTTRNLPVTFIGFSIPLAVFESVDAEDKEQVPHFLPPTQSDVRNILQSVLVVSQRLDQVNQKLTWAVAVVVGLGCFMLLCWLRFW